MSYKNIVVLIDGTPQSQRRIAVAAGLAATFGADLTGIAIVPPLERPRRVRAPGTKDMLRHDHEKSVAHAESLVQSFPGIAATAGAAAAAAKVVQAEPLQALAAAAQGADLVVLSQPDADDVGALGGHFVEQALTAVGHPVLLVPLNNDVQGVGRNVLIAWKNAECSARAVAGARPLLEKAGSVTVLVVDEHGGGVTPDEALELLQRQGVQAQGTVVKADDAGAAIVATAGKVGADLIVMGALARHRIAEMILGGATRSVLEKASVCVLMSH